MPNGKWTNQSLLLVIDGEQEVKCFHPLPSGREGDFPLCVWAGDWQLPAQASGSIQHRPTA